MDEEPSPQLSPQPAASSQLEQDSRSGSYQYLMRRMQLEQQDYSAEAYEKVVNPQLDYNILLQLCKDLEFISMLANPMYVVALLERGYFTQESFLEYIRDDLKVFLKNKKLFALVRYPEGLHNLKIIRQTGFAISMKDKRKMDTFILCCLNRNESLRKKAHHLVFMTSSCDDEFTSPE